MTPSPELPEVANIPLALRNVLLPTEFGALVDLANAAGRSIGEEIVVALRGHVSLRTPPASPSASTPSALSSTLEGKEAA